MLHCHLHSTLMTCMQKKIESRGSVENRRIKFKEDKVKQNKRDFQQNNEILKSRDSTRHSNRDIEIERFKSTNKRHQNVNETSIFIHLTIYSIRSIH